MFTFKVRESYTLKFDIQKEFWLTHSVKDRVYFYKMNDSKTPPYYYFIEKFEDIEAIQKKVERELRADVLRNIEALPIALWNRFVDKDNIILDEAGKRYQAAQEENEFADLKRINTDFKHARENSELKEQDIFEKPACVSSENSFCNTLFDFFCGKPESKPPEKEEKLLPPDQNNKM